MFFLENDDVGLRNLVESDAEGNYVNWFNDSEVCKYNSHHRFPMTKLEVQEYIRNANTNNRNMVFAVIEKKNNTHIGNISLQQINYIDRNAEIAFLFGEKDFWGKGFATSAAKLLIHHAFMELGMNRIYFGTSEENKGMQKVGEHLGFMRIGVNREALYKNGRFLNIYLYDLLKKEYMCKN